MRITYQPSAGRGDYEVSEATPAGDMPRDLLDLYLHVQLDGISINTGLRLELASGKYRLQSLPRGQHRGIQIQVAGVLLLPAPTRSEKNMESGQPVLRNDAYLMKNFNFGVVSHAAPDDFFTAKVHTIDCANHTYNADQVSVRGRMAQVERLWSKRTLFPPSIADRLGRHEQLVRSGGPFSRTQANTLTKAVRDLQEEVEALIADAEIPFSRSTDVVPPLLAFLSSLIEDTPLLPDHIDPQETELRRREIQKWQAFVRRRGAPSVKFRQRVGKAYDFRCIMCGGRFPPTPFNRIPGVDAAHILPWSQFDLDEVFNGVTLCKLHHWAFDEFLLNIIDQGDGSYTVEMMPDVETGLNEAGTSTSLLRAAIGPIPADRLPVDASQWPRAALLRKRLEDAL